MMVRANGGGGAHCTRRSTMRLLRVKSNTRGGSGKFSAAINLRQANMMRPGHVARAAHTLHLSKLELLDSSSVIAMPPPLAIVPFAPLLNKRV